ncbi:uracil-DNA glycosylase family protein [Sulfitobacter sp. D35]|uniref:uracil-DNA glycosylase family protein n=1 Tax=Sulfitobacter sp. D35 TaxID=3083252 RepID=UPI00296F6988|nr:uracil-DNA glycosylase family protein [Sulfitobacter sp. D35]MDW4499111.1 uracil-DNA glycosylase family protein [Sulfitobacter sp. D35]
MHDIRPELRNCTICRDRFAVTATEHAPRPVVWFDPGARLLIASQAPGARAHASQKPFTDPSGKRLRDWLGLDEAQFYDRGRVAIVPMAFCFPGYDAQGSDLPPPKVCAETWRAQALAMLPDLRLTLLIGGYSIAWHLGRKMPVTEAVRDAQAHGAGIFALPHPSWRNTGWMKRNPWFEAEILPELRRRVTDAMND